MSNGSSPAVPTAVPVIQQASASKQVAVIPHPPPGGNTIKSPNMVPIPTVSNIKLSTPVTNLPATRKRGVSASTKVLKAPNASKNTTPTGCTVITSERVMVSPCKHISYTVERNRRISSPLKPGAKRSGKRDCVKGRLDFGCSDEIVVSVDKIRVDDGTSTPEPDKDENVFGLDLPNIFGPNFSFSDLMSDLDFGLEGFASCPCEPTSASSTDSASGTSQDGNAGVDQVFSEFCSSVTEVISGNDMQGCSDAVTAVQSVTKSIKILCPAQGSNGFSEVA
ncbi:unnamed protein product [Linum trigynum]|uniref:Uncharacterized protein n=1 Tax=Linum trigynum TaxID=586398 RepID=A0AAV2DZL4_9ROSI